MKYICPKCKSENIIPLFAKDNIWKCLDCGYIGKPQVIKTLVEEFWIDFLKISGKSSE